MLKQTIIFGFLLFGLQAQADNNKHEDFFHFQMSEGAALIGDFEVKSCRITIPNLGVATDSVVATLVSKGYQPVVKDYYFGQKISQYYVLGFAEKTLLSSVHNIAELSGTTYLDTDVSASLVALQTKLILKVVGEEGMEGLYESSAYDATFIPGHSDIYEATDLPNCVSKK